jgi:3-phosphoshikimate 1-carboxyvinyltransferase
MNNQQINLPLTASTKSINAILDLPGSKSIANRVLPLAAMAQGVSTIHNVPDVGEDVQLMLAALDRLGIKCEKIRQDANGCSSYKIHGCGGKLSVSSAELFLGNSGTSIRFLTALLALLDGSYVLTGIQRMKERPIKDLVNALRQLGCQIECLENEGYPPLQTSPFLDNGIAEISLSGKISSQYLTGLLMALPQLKREITVKIYDELISKPYVEITLALLRMFGAKVAESAENCFTIYPIEVLQAIEYTVEPDASSASYFLAMGAMSGSARINNLGEMSLQGDKNFAKVLAQMGAQVEYHHGYILVQHKELNAITVNMEDMPDVAMTIAVLALFAQGTTTINGISSWKVKETDRLLAIYTELCKVGATVSYTDDSITITPPAKILPNISIDTYNDHRMAMCFSLLAVGGIPVVINNYECVGKTFANYFDVFNGLVY